MGHVRFEHEHAETTNNRDFTPKQQHLINLWRAYEAMLTGIEPLLDEVTTLQERAIADAANKAADRLYKRLIQLGGKNVRSAMYDWDTGNGDLPI